MLRNALAPELLELVETGSPGDLDFYNQYARQSGGPVLVLFSGTGRYAIPIARQNVPVIGLDANPGMIDLAKRKAQAAGAARAMFVRGDPTHFVSDSKHPLVVIPGGKLQELLSLDEQKSCLTAVRHALALGGKLVLDMPLLDPAAPVDEPPVLRRVGEQMAAIRSYARFDIARQICEEMVICDWLEPDGGVSLSQYAIFHRRYATPGEVVLLLEACGFQATCYGGFDRTPLLPGASRLVVEAERQR